MIQHSTGKDHIWDPCQLDHMQGQPYFVILYYSLQYMNRCHSCKNNRRQLLMLKCTHDTCIKCASDNYFINCKNRINNKKTKNNNYYCEKCLEMTELDANTIETLRKYFLENVASEEKNKHTRKERLPEKDDKDKDKERGREKGNREEVQRPRSLEVEIAERKRNLSKYLNHKQVEKFMEMQNQYGAKPKPTESQQKQRQEHRYTPQAHHITQSQKPQPNQYQLTRQQLQNARNKQPQRLNINDSFEQFAEQQRYNDYMRSNDSLLIQKGRTSQKTIPNQYKEMQYQIYHNGRGIINPQLRAAQQILEEEKPHQNSRNSSQSSNKVIGTIRSKRSNPKDPPTSNQETSKNIAGVLIKKQRVTSCKSADNLELANQIRCCNAEYNRNAENTQDGWDMQSKSTKRQEKTIPHGERNQSDTVQKILDTFQASQPRYQPRQIYIQKSRARQSPERERVETYYCKIHIDQQIIYFCLKCNQLICSECALHGSHKSHEIHSLKKSAMMLRQTLAHNTNTLTKLLIQEESKEKILKECLNQINIECTRQKEQIRSSFENFIFHVDKKYKELLREIEDRFSSIMSEYSQKLIESRSNYIQISKIKDNVCDTLQECSGYEDGAVSQTNIGAACNQLGNFNLKRPRNKQSSPSGIEYINKLTCRIQQLEQFLKSSNVLLFSNKKESLLSENSSLRLSESSNLLQEEKDQPTPQTITTPLGRSVFMRVPTRQDKRNKKIVVSSYSLNVKSRVKISQCDQIVESLVEMQEIVRSIKPELVEYELKSLL